jgi:hypothetical protein
MSDDPKPRPEARSDSKLKKGISLERQEQIAEWCAKPNERDAEGKAIKGTGGPQYAHAQLKADGFEVGLNTVYEFWRWWQLDQDLQASFAVEDQVLERTGDPKKARVAGEVMLMRLGLSKQDPKLIQLGAQTADARRSLDLAEESGRTKARQKDKQLSQKDRDLKLAERRVAVLEKKAEEAKAAANDSTLTDAQKAARIREIFKK